MDKIKELEEKEVWQNPKSPAENQGDKQRPIERPTEKEIIEKLAQIHNEQLIKETEETDEREEIEETEEPSFSQTTGPKERSFNLGTFMRWLGNFLIIVSVVGLFFTFWPIFTAEISYRIEKLKGIRFTVDRSQTDQSTSDRVTFGDLLGKGSPKILIPKSTDFGVIVEKIGANAPVIANVDASNPKEYNQKLQKGIAHAKGTVFPGQKGLSYLFAHSTLNPWDVPRYNAVFYLLRELEPQDRIVTFFQGRRYDYIVTEKKIVAPNDVSIFYSNFTEPVLVLQTCDPPGTTWRRLLVIAKLKQN